MFLPMTFPIAAFVWLESGFATSKRTHGTHSYAAEAAAVAATDNGTGRC